MTTLCAECNNFLTVLTIFVANFSKSTAESGSVLLFWLSANRNGLLYIICYVLHILLYHIYTLYFTLYVTWYYNFIAYLRCNGYIFVD